MIPDYFLTIPLRKASGLFPTEKPAVSSGFM